MADVDSFERENWPDGAYGVEQATIEGDILRLHVGYNACSRHDFDLVAWSYFAETAPVQAAVLLAHESEDCAASFEDTLRFDLAPLKEEYFRIEASESSSGVMDVRIQDQGQTYMTLRYEFRQDE